MPTHRKDNTILKTWQKQSLWTIAFVILVGLGAQVEIGNNAYFSFTLQTLSIAVCYFFMQRRARIIAALLYLITGVAGLAVFAGGTSGWEHLIGPSLGFFIAFVLAGIPNPWSNRWSDLFAYAAFLHITILFIGLACLLLYGWTFSEILDQGMELLPGAIIKSLLAAGIIMLLRSLGLNSSYTR